MTDDAQIAELEAGFKDLVEGLMTTLRGLREENALLRARLDERRGIPFESIRPVPAAAVLEERTPAVAVAPEVVPEPLESRRRGVPKVLKVCADCQQEREIGLHGRYCDDCRRTRASVRMTEAHASGKLHDINPLREGAATKETVSV